MRSNRAALLSILGLALPIVLLAAGWLVSSLRERDARLAEERASIASALDRARSAIDAGLRELAAREDERPFYVYSHYYSPPDVLALTDPVAISPLATESGDARIVGHFELDPDGTIRTPYSVEPGASTERATRVLAALDDTTRAALLDELGGTSSGNLIASAPEPPPPQEPQVRIVRTRVTPPPETSTEIPNTATTDENAFAQVGNFLATDITQAQAGDIEAYERVQSRGRAVPRVSRRDVPTRHSSAMTQPPVTEIVRRVVEPAPPPPPSLPPLVQGEIEVDYAPMTLRAFGEVLLLVRVVSHGESRVLDGVVLDRDRIAHTWVPETIARAVPTDRPTVVDADTAADACAARAPASALLPNLELCAPRAPLDAVSRTLESTLRYEIALLVGLLMLAAIAAWLILRTARRSAELARQKSAFVTAVSHELRTPLTTLRMHAEMLDEGLVPEERRAKVHAELVTESVRLARLVENVLEISRLEEGRRPLRASRADLAAHVAAIVDGQRGHARGKGFELETALPDGMLELPFDAAAIEQIVTNAIDNALKYAAKAETKTITIGLVRISRDGKPGVALRIRDHGPGVPAKERDRVFERFYRVERAETAHQPGTGLGLALVRELARAHGGEATLEDAAPGTRLVIWLPLG